MFNGSFPLGNQMNALSASPVGDIRAQFWRQDRIRFAPSQSSLNNHMDMEPDWEGFFLRQIGSPGFSSSGNSDVFFYCHILHKNIRSCT